MESRRRQAVMAIALLCGVLLLAGTAWAMVIYDDGMRPTPGVEPLPSSAPYPPGGCTRVIGYSVTSDWWSAGFEQLAGSDARAWEGVFVFGEMLPVWADPSFPGWTGDVKGGIQSEACGGDPTRLVIQIADLGFEQKSDDEMLDLLLRVIDNARAHYPSLERIDLIPIVGGPDHEECPDVMATRMHPRMDAIIASAVDGVEVFAGPDLVAVTCEDFRDATGHLTRWGATHVADVMASRFGA